jgi:hypothetical protein
MMRSNGTVLFNNEQLKTIKSLLGNALKSDDRTKAFYYFMHVLNMQTKDLTDPNDQLTVAELAVAECKSRGVKVLEAIRDESIADSLIDDERKRLSDDTTRKLFLQAIKKFAPEYAPKALGPEISPEQRQSLNLMKLIDHLLTKLPANNTKRNLLEKCKKLAENPKNEGDCEQILKWVISIACQKRGRGNPFKNKSDTGEELQKFVNSSPEMQKAFSAIQNQEPGAEQKDITYDQITRFPFRAGMDFETPQDRLSPGNAKSNLDRLERDINLKLAAYGLDVVSQSTAELKPSEPRISSPRR